MRIFDITQTQLINFDIFSGFSQTNTNHTVYPLLSFFIREQSIFNITYVKFF